MSSNKEDNRYVEPRFCKACGKEFNYDWRIDPRTRRKSPPLYCSYKCSHSRPKSEEQKKRLSETAKNSEKVKAANQRINEYKKTDEWKQKISKKAKYISKICPVCGKEFKTTEARNKIYCSNDCWKQVSGGFREGSVTRYKHGIYNGYHYDSSWELKWLKWAIANNIKFERNKKGFPYIFKGEQHLYYPDFYLPDSDEYIEIKGIVDDLWEAKKAAFPYKLIIYTKSEIKALKI